MGAFRDKLKSSKVAFTAYLIKNSATLAMISVFYDGYCPLCVAEMNKLRTLDKAHNLQLVDIQQPDFAERFPTLNWTALNARIHVQLADGQLLSGLDATHAAWQAVGHGWLYAPLRWPLIRWFADHAYDFFARNRYRISKWLTGQERCKTCTFSQVNSHNKGTNPNE